MDIVISNKKLISEKKKRIRRLIDKNTHMKECCSEITPSTPSKVESSSPELTADPRFQSEQFRQNVRKVLEWLGMEANYGNFRQWDQFIDWTALARSIDHPVKTAICHILDGNGEIVKNQGRPVTVAREIAACSESEAAEILAKESKVFVRWW